jgi:hypothetical protein
MQIMRSLRFAVLALFILAIPVMSSAQIVISVGIAPPALPVYVQPPCPADGYIWTPGYWGYSEEDGYYWVPGTWVEAPQVGYLWTPGYWGWGEDRYAWHEGYWGPHIGFYGGVNYGFGYGGDGYEGGHWEGGRFAYNRSVTNVNVTVVHNVYNRTVVVHNNTRVSFNGGHGGVNRRPTANEERFSHEQHVQRTSMQNEHEHAAAGNRELRASVNHGKPAIAATARPGQFSGHGVVAARKAGAPYHAPAANRGGANREAAAPRANNKSVPRPGNTPNRGESHVARPANKTPERAENNRTTPRNEPAARPAPATHNNVARPPANDRVNTPRPENNARPQNKPAERNTPRPPSTPRPQAAPRENAPRATPAPRPQARTQPQREARPQTPRAPSAPRSESRPQAAPRPQSAPHPQAAPKAEKPEERKH